MTHYFYTLKKSELRSWWGCELASWGNSGKVIIVLNTSICDVTTNICNKFRKLKVVIGE